ncbi:uncharacterized protein L3040_005320 [Drepanopeziza brunnea f. sp. 'multigermtubi']|uniref:uncharacterized protein n=1 Tax=Drepanopeziza brunnea f. sp. 'multigermtubi' TaxID=698441 RepID=UPI00239A72BF|nr:hypothetical protein L3040_005320 [Drepanopeziza brunnea f. sp. 'multigermtubi']
MSETFQPQQVTFEHHRGGDSIGIAEVQPRLSWRFQGNAKDWQQGSYELQIKSSGRDSIDPIDYRGTFTSSESVLVPWPCRALESRESATVQVRVTGTSTGSVASPWSPPSTVEIGLVNRDDWHAKMVAAPKTISTSGSLRPVLFRKAFKLAGEVKYARLYITAYGLYEASINGKTVGDHVLAPGWTSYKYNLHYQTFDVTKLLKKGENAIGAEAGEGWYSDRLGYNGGRRCIYGDALALLAQLEVTFYDGTQVTIASGKTWRSWVSPRISSEIYDGEIYDARSELPGWNSVEFDDEHWSAVTELVHPYWGEVKKFDKHGQPFQAPRQRLKSPQGPPVRRAEKVKVKEILSTPSGKTVLDFGQNLVGWLSVRVRGPPGHTILFHHVEVLENGEIATRPLRDCKATDTLILGESEILWEPKFTFHGFRYVQVDNWPSADGKTLLENIEAIVVYTDMERTGWFSCSDSGELGINKLHQNIVWGMKSNFVSIPTDCPQRDERLGWTGDIQVFCPTASFLYDISGMLSGWLDDLAIEQEQELDGVVGDVVPMVPGITELTGKAAWSDAGIMVPWDLYNAFGDPGILKAQLESMKMWLEKGMARQVSPGGSEKGLWNPAQFQYGDWLDPDAPPDSAGAGKTDPQFVANAYLVHVSTLLWKVCKTLGSEALADYIKYKDQAARLKAMFQEEYVTPNGRLVPETMTSLALALQFDLLSSQVEASKPSVNSPTYGRSSEDADKKRIDTAANRLEAVVRASGFKIGTGFVGTPLILPALTSVGKTQLAYRMLQEDQCPSWLYPLTMGATTQWERWDSMYPSGQLNNGAMTSFNHYALGSVAAWLHSTVGGISPKEPGWKVVRIEPRPGGRITSADVKHLSPYGMVECSWSIVGEKKKEKDVFVLKVSLPPNSSGEVKLPGSNEVVKIGSGNWNWEIPYRAPDVPAKKFEWIYQKLGPDEF